MHFVFSTGHIVLLVTVVIGTCAWVRAHEEGLHDSSSSVVGFHRVFSKFRDN